ncbi:MAG TPA: beta-propeller fold lactonase family protein [Terracidiphilus sp.]|jgi:6-phosphogluconolactonase (cycloisomerase 2 family)
MKFTKFGKALLLSVFSAGVILSVTSCIQSYSVGYLYVTGTVTSGTNGNGIVSGFKINHDSGGLTPINGLPISSGGSNPVRAVLLDGSRFLYVLNRGVNKEGNGDCTTTDPCLNPNITQFVVGANGILTAQETFFTQGVNPIRMVSDNSGNYLYVLDHDSPDPASTNSNPIAATKNSYCAAALTGATTCGDITAFQVNATTGRLSLVVNDQVTSTLGGGNTPLTYFPVPVNPIDFVMSGNLLTLSGTPAAGDVVFPYVYNSTNGQLTVNQNSAQSLTNTQNANGQVDNATAIVSAGGYVYVLDNEPITVNGSVASQSQILPFSIGSGGALLPAVSGPIPDDANQSNPIFLAVESKNKWLYVANQGNLSNPEQALSGISGFVINSPYQPTEMAGTPINFGSGGGPQCLVEDPSNQYFYTANFIDSTVTGQSLNEQSGNLTPLNQSTKAPTEYSLNGPATWCLVDARID